jgi:spermidine synthase
MTESDSRPVPIPVAAAAAACAGAATLAIELVWMRLLSLTFGSASVAAGCVVAALMLGMALGSAWAARRTALPLGLALIALGAFAALSSFILPALGSLGSASGILVSVFMTAASIPMGLVVPLLVARLPRDDPRLSGLLYASNTFGSAAAVLLAGFLLLPALGNQKTLWCASAVLAGLGAFLSRGRPGAEAELSSPHVSWTPVARRILVVYGVSAFAAMASEIGWMRALVFFVGSSTYANTIVLGVYVAGLGIGSALATGWSSARAFGSIQLLLAFICFGTLHLLGHLPPFFGRVFQSRVASLGSFSLVALGASAVALLPPTILIGASFSIAVRWLGGLLPPPRAVGMLLAVATAASAAGALLASFGLIPITGVQGTLILPIFLHAVVGSVTLSYLGQRRRIWPSLAAAALLALLYWRTPWDVRTVQSGPYIYGAEKTGKEDSRKVLFAKDDRVSSVAVFEHPDGNRVLRIDGKTDASLSQVDLVTQLLTAHLPLAVHGKPERVVLVGLGSGMTLASCLKYDPKEVVCIEISPAVVRASRYFDVETGGPLTDPRVKLKVADARSVIRRLDGRFDVILNEPSNLWIAGMAGLFTEEFYQSCAAHLSAGGLMGQWVHAYGLTEDCFRDAVATFQQVFPYLTVWELWVSGDYLLIGSQTPYVVDVAKLEHWLAKPEVADDLRRIDVTTPGGLLGDLVGMSRGPGGAPSARIQTDDGLHLEFQAPLGFYGRNRMAPLGSPPVNVSDLSSILKGRGVDWAVARDLLRRGIRAVLEDKPMPERMVFFRQALEKYPEERQARLMLEDQVDQCFRKSDWDQVPRESRKFVEAKLRKIAGMKAKAALPGALIEEYRRALEVSPDHDTVLTGLSEVLLAAGALADADEVSGRAVGKRPDSPRARLVRGKVYAAQKKVEEARAEWVAARLLAPDSTYGKEADQLLKEK